MTRQEILNDMKQWLGMAPDWLSHAPDHVLEHLWLTMRDFQLGQTVIPNKYKELIGLGVASQMQCPYCIYFHTEVAKLHGATDQEIQEALGMAFFTAGASTYIAGTGTDIGKFRQDVQNILKYVASHAQQPRTKAA